MEKYRKKWYRSGTMRGKSRNVVAMFAAMFVCLWFGNSVYSIDCLQASSHWISSRCSGMCWLEKKI